MILKNGWRLLFATHNLVLAVNGEAESGEGDRLKFAVWRLAHDGTTDSGDYFSVLQNGPSRPAAEVYADAMARFWQRMDGLDQGILSRVATLLPTKEIA